MFDRLDKQRQTMHQFISSSFFDSFIGLIILVNAVIIGYVFWLKVCAPTQTFAQSICCKLDNSLVEIGFGLNGNSGAQGIVLMSSTIQNVKSSGTSDPAPSFATSLSSRIIVQACRVPLFANEPYLTKQNIAWSML